MQHYFSVTWLAACGVWGPPPLCLSYNFNKKRRCLCFWYLIYLCLSRSPRLSLAMALNPVWGDMAPCSLSPPQPAATPPPLLPHLRWEKSSRAHSFHLFVPPHTFYVSRSHSQGFQDKKQWALVWSKLRLGDVTQNIMRITVKGLLYRNCKEWMNDWWFFY